MLLSEAVAGKACLIHDNALMFNIDFLAYNLVSTKTGVEAPNMNSTMERFFRTVRREALDNFLMIGRAQIETILEEYVAFYNSQRHIRGAARNSEAWGAREDRWSCVPERCPGWVASSLLQTSGVTDGKSPPYGVKAELSEIDKELNLKTDQNARIKALLTEEH